jgi:pimeloyl-ACP methyl ester carboxylesterase
VRRSNAPGTDEEEAVTILDHLSLLHGWLPGLVAVGAWGTLFFGVAWWRRAAWHWIVLAAIAGGAAALIAWSLDIPARVGSTYPRSFLAWGALPLFALGAAVWQWTRVRWWRRVVGALAAPLLAMFGAVQINAHYGYLSSLGDVLGAKLPGEISARTLEGMTSHASGRHGRARAVEAIPAAGVVAQFVIPPTVSGFTPRRGYVWVPPVWFSNPRPRLPVIMLLSGTPGSPRDWLGAGRALQLANAWAASHGGNAPLMVAPDINGDLTGDTECIGRAETYLTIDVRAFMRERFGAALTSRQWAVAGMSEGGTCALELVARHPNLFRSFADFSGDEGPTLGRLGRTMRALFGDSVASFVAHDPATWFRADAADRVAGFIAVGSNDHGYMRHELRVAALARMDHLAVTLEVIPGGGHNWPTAARAMRDFYPWLVGRLGTYALPSPSRPQHKIRLNA